MYVIQTLLMYAATLIIIGVSGGVLIMCIAACLFDFHFNSTSMHITYRYRIEYENII